MSETTEVQHVTKAEALELAQTAARAAVEDYRTKNPGLTQEQLQAAISQDRAQLADLISGKTNGGQKDAVRELLDADPSAAFAIFGDALRSAHKQEIDELKSELATMRERDELTAAAREVLADRPDITSDAKLARLVNQFFKAGDKDLPVKERMKEALKETDLLLEEQGLGSKDARVQKFSTVKTASAGATSAPQELKKTADEAFKAISDERWARHQAIRSRSL